MSAIDTMRKTARALREAIGQSADRFNHVTVSIGPVTAAWVKPDAGEKPREPVRDDMALARDTCIRCGSLAPTRRRSSCSHR